MRIKNKPTFRFTPAQAEGLGELIQRALPLAGKTEEIVAKEVFSSQSQVSRIYNGKFVRRAALLEKLCALAEIDLNAHIHALSPRGSQAPPTGQTMSDAMLPIPQDGPSLAFHQLPRQLRDALASVWDGTPLNALPVAELLKAVSKCIPADVSNTRQRAARDDEGPSTSPASSPSR